MDKNYRIHTNIASDTILNVNMTQDYDFLEVLTMKLRQKDAYKLHSSNYGVIIGRVLANDAFGIPNAKISVFIERDTNDSVDIENIYPYSDVTSKDKDGRRYNLLPDYSDDDCYRIVGTFPNKRLLLDNDIQLEIYDKYWKYTTVTNNAGDYMIFGVPSGNQQIHVDIDLSDIGILSQKPRDFEYKGYNLTMFDNPNQFKESTNLESLAQLFSQDKSVFVYPFWGDADNGVAAITRADIQIQYKFEPTCVFMGSIISDNEGNSIGHKCAAEIDNGMNNQLIAGEGTIEMIRKTTDGLIEEYQIQGNQLINENGVWCYQIPMNLDFVGTDEYGNIVPTDNPNKGIPTRTQVRFRISKNETGDEGFSRHTAKYLVPMNPIFDETKVRPTIKDKGQEVEKLYNFGSNTPESCFRDLYWNNVYSVKNYIPKVQVAHRPYSKNYSALKGANLVDDQNPIPFNKLRIDIPFMYMIVCILFTIVMWIVSIVNLAICLINKIFSIFNKIRNIRIPVIRVRPFSWIPAIPYIGCVSLGGGLSEDNTAFYPGCDCKEGLNASSCPDDMEGNCKKRASKGELLDLVQQRLAEDYKIIKLDLYQDWINGCLYMPLWYWRKRKKKSYLFGLIKSRAKNEFCDCNKSYSRLKTYVTCNVVYNNNSLGVLDASIPEGEDSWHRSKSRAGQVRFKHGLIKGVENKDGLTVYYYSAVQATAENSDADLAMDMRVDPFYAIRLYATDIILLGNLNENNLYGIPQFFKTLPSTTANILPIATIYESEDPDDDSNYSKNEIAGGEDSGVTVTTGMDWGRDGDEGTPQYKDGLFMDLRCVAAKTKAKSCFNVERLSEYGVSLDMSHTMSYSNGASTIESGPIDSDGFVTKYELDDTENRAMFATMNHIGFVPQTYQDSISGYTTQVEDKNTNYLIPKFKYIYPVDFDGRMQPLMERYKGGFEQSMYDERDERYLTFRFGAEKNDKQIKDEYHRIRHFYHNNNDNFEMPLYNNSYYFYFGIKKGSTAIDKFNKLFYSECFKNSKKPFTLDISYKGKTYCEEKYNVSSEACRNFAYSYIRVKSDDIKTPFSYTLYDAKGNVIITEDGMMNTDFVIGGKINNNGEIVSNNEGNIMYQNCEVSASEDCILKDGNNEPITLENQEYVIEVRDSNGKAISEKVELKMDKIRFEYQAVKLGTKFYNTADTRIDYICNDINNFYGIIRITKFYIDSYEYRITGGNVNTYNENKKTYDCYISGTPISNSVSACLKNASKIVTVFFRLSVIDGSVNECLCDKSNGISGNENMNIGGTSKPYYFKTNISEDQGNIEFYVYQPNTFVGTIYEICDGKVTEDNYSSELIKVNNGENFNTYLNTMPVRFMLGTVSDSSEATIANKSSFYSSSPALSPNNENISGWFGTHIETTYKFDTDINKTINKNRKVWSDFLTINDLMEKPQTKKTILRYKFDKMFKLSEATYVTTNSDSTFRYTYTGGAEPVLSRSIAPYYSKYSIFNTALLYSDNNYATVLTNYPNIVGFNYNDKNKKSYEWFGEDNVRFNEIYKDKSHLGNYFAAFTKNGRYTSTTEVDCTINIMELPNYAAVNVESTPKRIGQEKTINGDYPIPVHTLYHLDGSCNKRTQPYLRAMFVDRRLDYNLIILAPALGETVELFKNQTSWKKSRISGITYNGIEMAYDSEYNVITANTSAGADGVVTKNTVLEYSYQVPITDNNANTIFNVYPSTLRRFYEAYINSTDIRNYFWSDYNNTTRGYLGTLGFEGNDYVIDNGLTIYNHQGDGYNGNFSLSSYPTKRKIDIGDIPSHKDYYFNITSCSYGMSPELTEDYGIKSYTTAGETIELSIDFSDPIKFIPPSDDNPNYANLILKKKGTEVVNGAVYTKFMLYKETPSPFKPNNTNNFDIMFSYNKVSSNDFDVYTMSPEIIEVLGNKVKSSVEDNIMDGISYYKRTPKTESLDARINNIHLYTYNTPMFRLVFGNYGDIILPEGVDYDDASHYFKKDDELLPSDDNDFANIIFHTDFFNTSNKIVLDGTKMFTILVKRLYVSNEDDKLVKKIMTYETSSLYDLRDVLLRVGQNTDIEDTYVEVRTSNVDVSTIQVPNGGEVDPETGEISLETEPVTPSGDSKIYTQVITFYMACKNGQNDNDDNNSDPYSATNMSVADYGVNGYIFKFTNNNGDVYELTPESISANNISDNIRIIEFKVRWTQDMGILADREWSAGATVSVFIKTPSSFIYKLNEFKLNPVNPEDTRQQEAGSNEGNPCKYNRETKESCMVEYDEEGKRMKYKTTTNIVN